MKYADAVVRSARLTARNPFAVLLVSLSTSVSMVPFFTGVYVAGTAGGLVGLWTTSLLLGFVSVGGARIMVVVAEREVSLGTSYFWDGIRSGTKMGPVVGLGTFVSVLVAIVLATNPFNGIAGMSVALVGVYVLVSWFVIAMFSLTMWAATEDSKGVIESFTEGVRLILKRPVPAVWLVVQTVGWTLLSILLFVAPVLLLPGFIQLIGTTLILEATDKDAS